MPSYRFAKQDFYFPYPLSEVEAFIFTGAANQAAPVNPYSFHEDKSAVLISSTIGSVGEQDRQVEVWSVPSGFLLKVEDGSNFYISLDGQTILRSDWQSRTGVSVHTCPGGQCQGVSDLHGQLDLQKLDREILLSPALVFALALRGVWSLHASAAMYKENVIVFLGESGQGKSTLAAYLSQSPGWRLVADDILPVRMDANEVNILPHFPQLKLPVDAQPGVKLPENLPLTTICVLTHAEPDEVPELQKISTAQTVQALLGHVAGTRLFNAELLSRHLEFSTQAAKQISAYRLIHPHRRDTLPLVREFLEKIC